MSGSPDSDAQRVGATAGWYAEKREGVEAAFSRARRLDGTATTTLSPSGKYSLEVVQYEIAPGRWNYSCGTVRREAAGAVVAEIKRNFGHFPFAWSEGHPTWHDYLIAGEDYQGQTIIELDTGSRIDYVPDGAKGGVGFCWTAHYPSPDGAFLFVDGCVWACPYELILFDFNTPMQLPYREVKRWPVSDVTGFQPDGSFVFEYELVVRASDGRPLDELSDTEETAALDDYDKLCREKRIQVRWHPDHREDIRELGAKSAR